MTTEPIDVVAVSLEEAEAQIAEFWVGGVPFAQTLPDIGQLVLRIEPRNGGGPCSIAETGPERSRVTRCESRQRDAPAAAKGLARSAWPACQPEAADDRDRGAACPARAHPIERQRQKR